MTVLLAIALRDHAILVADGLQSDLRAGTTRIVDKTHDIAPNVAAAKFGYAGPEADAIWARIQALPLATRMLASWTNVRGAGIHWIDFKNDGGTPNSSWYRAGNELKFIAQGPDGISAIGHKAISDNIVNSPTPTLDIASCAIEFVKGARSLSPEPFGFPAHVRVVGLSGQHHHTILDDQTGAGIHYPL